MSKREFSLGNEYRYHLGSPLRWIISHVWRYKHLFFCYIALVIVANALYAAIPLIVGEAFNAVLQGSRSQLVLQTLTLLSVVLLSGCATLGARFFPELLSKRVVRDARAEVYLSLLGKSQTFHNRQRVGDIMARIASDITQLGTMIVPGFDIVFDAYLNLVAILVVIGILRLQLLLVPLLFTISFLLAVRFYSNQLAPISDRLRTQFGELNAGLSEVLRGIEVIKATGQEEKETHKFERQADLYRRLFIKNGYVQSWYLAPLLLSVALVFAFAHGLLLVAQGQISVGSLVAFLSLMVALRYPTFNANWSISLIQLGISGAGRILHIVREEADLDENEDGYRGGEGGMRGEIVFERVSFGYEGTTVLKNISFHAEAGQTIAIVGQTGSGKSTLTRLINRIYDVDSGRILIDGVDVRAWNLGALRSQISTIEQDIFLFSRSIAENIAYGLGQQASQEAIERAARDAQAHEFILGFREGYQTTVGERGVMLSGGQRQRIAIARALLTNLRILILDDSTSAIDSATENEIQQAIERVLEGRTTFLITHRLAQIRRADKILVLRRGELIDQGTHAELINRCAFYRRIFACYAPPSSKGEQNNTEKEHIRTI